DQSRDVGEHELAALVVFERPERGLDRREGIVADLWTRPREAAKQRRLARVGSPDDPEVGEQLQPELERRLLARKPELGEARRLARRGGKAPVSAPARPAPGDDRA